MIKYAFGGDWVKVGSLLATIMEIVFGVMGSYPKCERGSEERHEILARPAQGGGMHRREEGTSVWHIGQGTLAA